MWMVGGRLLTRNAACTANPKNPTAARATGTMTPGDTRAFGTDGLNRKSPPRTSVMTPAAVNAPMPGAFNSRRKKAADATSNVTPTSWTGSMPNDTNAATSEIAPRTRARGWWMNPRTRRPTPR